MTKKKLYSYFLRENKHVTIRFGDGYRGKGDILIIWKNGEFECPLPSISGNLMTKDVNNS